MPEVPEVLAVPEVVFADFQQVQKAEKSLESLFERGIEPLPRDAASGIVLVTELRKNKGIARQSI